MADKFWQERFDKLIDNLELLKLICFDTANSDLLSWIKPNHELAVRCNRFLQKGNIANKAGLVNELVAYAKTYNPLRRIILFTWVDKNQPAMDFFKLPGNSTSIEKLANGEFGNTDKVRILSFIDPREGSDKLYKSILEKADTEALKKAESERLEKEKARIGTISNIELEAALHSKEIIASPDTPEDPSAARFNEVVYDELQKIKAALEILEDVNSKLKAENKELRTESGNRKNEIATYSSKLEASVKKSQNLDSQLQKEKAITASLTTQLAAAKAEIAAKPAPTLSDSEIGDLRHNLEEALKERDKLKSALENREASLNRLKQENEELLKASNAATNQQQLVSNLQQKLADTEAKISRNITSVAGQLVTKARFNAEAGEKAGKKCWLFISITGQDYYLDLNEIPANLAVPEEYLIVSFDENEKLVSIKSLETDKLEVYGFIKVTDGNAVLATETEGDLPIQMEITDKWTDRPARGTYLPELENRAAGIYKIDILPATAKLNKAPVKSGHKKVKESESDDTPRTFNGEKVIIFGGDRVGLEYEHALAKVGLTAKWYSGFSLLSEISLGFGRPDLMVIVTRQISHALLRELTAYAEKNSIKIAYANTRGVSSIIRLIHDVQ